MIKNKYVLAQILSFVPRHKFRKIVLKHCKHPHLLNFTHWEQFICLSYGQYTQKDSIRSIILCLNSRPKKLYHLGIHSKLSLSTLSNANRTRNWIIYRELAYVLIEKAINIGSNPKKTSIFNLEDTPKYQELNETLQGVIYALDSSTIDLCLSIFDWAKFRKKKEGLNSIHY